MIIKFQVAYKINLARKDLDQNPKRPNLPTSTEPSPIPDKLRPGDHLCAKCDVFFSSSQALEIHIRSHSGPKDFRCTTCGKEFSKEENLQLHYKLHLGQKDYVCSICQKSYFTKSGLQVTNEIRIILNRKFTINAFLISLLI